MCGLCFVNEQCFERWNLWKKVSNRFLLQKFLRSKYHYKNLEGKSAQTSLIYRTQTFVLHGFLINRSQFHSNLNAFDVVSVIQQKAKIYTMSISHMFCEIMLENSSLSSQNYGRLMGALVLGRRYEQSVAEKTQFDLW